MNKKTKLLSKILLIPCFFSIFNSTKCFSSDPDNLKNFIDDETTYGLSFFTDSNNFENLENQKIEDFTDEFYRISEDDKTTYVSSLNDNDILGIFNECIDYYLRLNPNPKDCLASRSAFADLERYFVEKKGKEKRMDDEFRKVLFGLIKPIRDIALKGILQVSPVPDICSKIICQLVRECGQSNSIADFKKVCCNFIYQLLHMSNIFCYCLKRHLGTNLSNNFTSPFVKVQRASYSEKYSTYYYMDKLVNGIICVLNKETYKCKDIPGINIYNNNQEEIFQLHCKYMKDELMKLFKFLTDCVLRYAKKSQECKVDISFFPEGFKFEYKYFKMHPESYCETSPYIQVLINNK